MSTDSIDNTTERTKKIDQNKKEDALALSVGALAVDLTCDLTNAGMNDKSTYHTSHPGKVTTSIGGVAHNVALAASYRGLQDRVKIISEIDEKDSFIVDSVEKAGILSDGIKKGSRRTGRYIAMHDKGGNLMVACADMETIETLDIDHIKHQIRVSDKAKVVVFDGNINVNQMTEVVKLTDVAKENTTVVFEPTSVPRSAKLARVKNLGVFPNHSLDLITPNHHELETIYSSFKEAEKFDVDNWFPVIDALKVQTIYYPALEKLAKSSPDLSNIISDGSAQQALQLLPYIPNILLKSGSKGVISFQLVTDASSIKKKESHNNGVVCIGNKQLDIGIVVQHFAAQKVDDSEIVSVTGAGDTLLGSLVADIALGKWNLRPGVEMTQAIDRAQKSSALTIQSPEAVSPEIRGL